MISSRSHAQRPVDPNGEPGSTRRATLVIATCSALIEAGLLLLLPRVPELSHVGSAFDSESAIRALGEQRPDVLVLDETLAPQMHEVADSPLRPRVLLLTARRHLGTEPVCGEHCACGLVREQAPLTQVLFALRTVANCSAPTLGHGYCASCALRGTLKLPPLPLSAREYVVFERIGRGQRNQKIARECGVSVKTVESHRESIKRKLGLASGAALIEAASGWRRGEYTYSPPGHGPTRRRRASRAS